MKKERKSQSRSEKGLFVEVVVVFPVVLSLVVSMNLLTATYNLAPPVYITCSEANRSHPRC